MNQADVIIIGAGISGLSAAIALEKAGVKYEIIDKSDRPGGRIRTIQKDGFTLDYGFQVIHPNYEEVRESGVWESLDFRSFHSGAIFCKEKSLRWYRNPFLDVKGFIKSRFSSPFPLKETASALRIFHDAWRSDEDFWKLAFEQDCMSYLKNRGFGDETIKNFFVPFFGGVFLDKSLGAGKHYFLWLLKKFMAGRPGIPKGGMQSLPFGLAAQLPADRKFHFGTYIQAIEDSVVFARDGRRFKGKYIIDAAGLEMPSQVKFNSTRNIYLTGPFSDNLPNALLLNGNHDGEIMHFCFPSALHPSHAPEGKSLVSVTMKNPGTEISTANILQELAYLYPHIDWKKWEMVETFFIREAVPSYINSISSLYQSKGNIYRCGDVYSYPSMNGAMRSGREAAEEIIKKLKS
jgi:phytoene dehydrogenase-like protein